MQPGKRGRQLKSVADIARAARKIINEVDTDVMPASKAQAILAGLALVFDVMRHSSDSGTLSPKTPSDNRL